jgi:hypothetical protein
VGARSATSRWLKKATTQRGWPVLREQGADETCFGLYTNLQSGDLESVDDKRQEDPPGCLTQRLPGRFPVIGHVVGHILRHALI